MRVMKYNVLTYLGQFVDIDRLPEGIYTTSIPKLYDVQITVRTIKSMFENGAIMRILPSYKLTATIENLDKCQMTTVELRIPQ